ncbi:unnamed protein product [Boreogadus saida]
MVENAGKLKISLRPPGEVPHPFGRPNPDGTDAAAAARDAAAAARDAAAAARDVAATARDAAAAARDAAAAARDAAAAARDAAAAARDAAAAARDAAAAARDTAAAAGEKATAPPADADVGTGRPCMLATYWAQGTSGTPTIPARVMNRDTQALLDTGSVVTLLRPDLAGGKAGEPMEVACVHGDTRTYPTCHVVVRTTHGVFTIRAGIVPHLPVLLLIGRDCPILRRLGDPALESRGRRDAVAVAARGWRNGIPPRKPRPGRARGTVKDGVYHPHPPAGDGEQPFRFPNQEVAENVVKATCMLHNFLRWDASTTIPARSSTGTSTAEPSQGLQNAPRLGTNNAGRDVVAVREKFAQYFMSEAGRVPWQDNI